MERFGFPGFFSFRGTQVTSLLTRMASDGEIPAMPTPTYGKIMSLADQASDESKRLCEVLNLKAFT